MPLPRDLIEMLESVDSHDRVMPATALYNEGWMLKLVLATAKRGIACFPFTFEPGARWFSEPQLYSAFCRRSMHDPLGERTTSADGAVGHFAFTPASKTGLALDNHATQFIVLEAKMAATFAKGTKNAPGFDQAARTVACMAETLRRRGRPVDTMSSLGFYVVAPRRQIDRFGSHLDATNINQKVLTRIEKYDGEWRAELDMFRSRFFEPLLRTLTLKCLAWEDILGSIAIVDRDLGAELWTFYERALEHNFGGPMRRT